MKKVKCIDILGVPIARLNFREVIETTTSLIGKPGKKTFFYVHAHCLNMANKYPEYKEILQNASLVYSDGIGPVLASKLLGRPLIERTPTPDFIEEVLRIAQNRGWSLYLLGAKQKSIEIAVQKLKDKLPRLKIVGFHNGYFNERENKKIIHEINLKKPTIVLVGMGTPKQEKWIRDNKDKINAKVFWAVGAMFDVISAIAPRAPLWIQKLDLEWLFRLFQEPKRLWKRYTIGNLQFIKSVIFLNFRKKKLFNFRKLNKQDRTWISKIEAARSKLEKDKRRITFVDYGARSAKLNLSSKEMYKGKRVVRTIGEICKMASKKKEAALFLFQLIRVLKPKVSLELGTSLGISAAYQGAALALNKKGTLSTIEGDNIIASIAKEILGNLGLSRITIVQGRFQDVLPKVLPKITPIDFVFIDGHHDRRATIEYFKQVLKFSRNGSVFILDDIRWSSGMKKAWEVIKNHERVKASDEFLKMGIVIVSD